VNHAAQAIVTIVKLGGTFSIADIPRPNQTDSRLMIVVIAIAAPGLGVTMIAVAAGVTTRANSNNVPTACTAIVTVSPSSTMKMTESARTGTFLASATWALTDVNSSGR
jgi:hypothetical protein